MSHPVTFAATAGGQPPTLRIDVGLESSRRTTLGAAWILPETDAEGALDAAARLRHAINEEPFHGGRPAHRLGGHLRPL